MKEVFTVSACVCWDDDKVSNELSTVDCEAKGEPNDGILYREGLLASIRVVLCGSSGGGVLKSCSTCEKLVGSVDFPARVETLEDGFLPLICKIH